MLVCKYVRTFNLFVLDAQCATGLCRPAALLLSALAEVRSCREPPAKFETQTERSSLDPHTPQRKDWVSARRGGPQVQSLIKGDDGVSENVTLQTCIS